MMPLGSALIALTLLGASAPGPADGPIATQVGVVDMKGVEWRGVFHARLSLVAQNQGTTVWTADRATAAALAKSAGEVRVAPQVISDAMAEAVVNASNGRPYVARLGRVADGAFNQATAVAFEPHVDAVHEGWQVRISGRALDQGVLARVNLTDTRFDAFHTVTCPETVQPKAEGGKPHTFASQYQVPEVSTAAVSGEWLLPKDGALVVSTGVHSRPGDGKSKAEVTERLFIIEAKPAPRPASEAESQAVRAARSEGRLVRFDVTSGALVAAVPEQRYVVLPATVLERLTRPSAAPSLPPLPIAVAGVLSNEPVALAPSTIPSHGRSWHVMPTVPSRSLPGVVQPDGTVTPAFPLSDEAEAASFEEESAEPRPSPQAPHHRATTKPAPPADLAGKPRVLMALPVGPLMAEFRFVPGTPNRLALMLRLGSLDVNQVLDQAVQRASAEEPVPAPARSNDGEKPQAPPRSVQIKVSAQAKPAAATGRPVKVELPIGPSTVRIEIRAARTAAPQP